MVSPSRTMTEADIVNFAGLTGDWHPIHTDIEYAKKTPLVRELPMECSACVLGVRLSSGSDSMSHCRNPSSPSTGWIRSGLFIPAKLGIPSVVKWRLWRYR